MEGSQATMGEANPPWKTTIIVSTSVKDHEASRMLTSQQHRIRFSDSVEAGSFIFPLSGTAFLLFEPKAFPECCEDSGLVEQIEKFVKVHRNSFLLLYTPFSGRKEQETLSALQRRFFDSSLRILPIRNPADMVKGMLTIAKATSRPHVDRIQDRMALARAHIIENSPVWETLRSIMETQTGPY